MSIEFEVMEPVKKKADAFRLIVPLDREEEFVEEYPQFQGLENLDIIINLATGIIVGAWPYGAVRMCLKPCDRGTYVLLDGCIEVARRHEEYVPCIGGIGGDYVELDIDAEGKIKGWKRPSPAALSEEFFPGDE